MISIADPVKSIFLMAWVSVPDLAVHPAIQRYEHLRLRPPAVAPSCVTREHTEASTGS